MPSNRLRDARAFYEGTLGQTNTGNFNNPAWIPRYNRAGSGLGTPSFQPGSSYFSGNFNPMGISATDAALYGRPWLDKILPSRNNTASQGLEKGTSMVTPQAGPIMMGAPRKQMSPRPNIQMKPPTSTIPFPARPGITMGKPPPPGPMPLIEPYPKPGPYDTVDAKLTPTEGVLNTGAMALPGMKPMVENANAIGQQINPSLAPIPDGGPDYLPQPIPPNPEPSGRGSPYFPPLNKPLPFAQGGVVPNPIGFVDPRDQDPAFADIKLDAPDVNVDALRKRASAQGLSPETVKSLVSMLVKMREPENPMVVGDSGYPAAVPVGYRRGTSQVTQRGQRGDLGGVDMPDISDFRGMSSWADYPGYQGPSVQADWTGVGRIGAPGGFGSPVPAGSPFGNISPTMLGRSGFPMGIDPRTGNPGYGGVNPGLGGYNNFSGWGVPGGGTFMGGTMGDYVRQLGKFAPTG